MGNVKSGGGTKPAQVGGQAAPVAKFVDFNRRYGISRKESGVKPLPNVWKFPMTQISEL